jgi:hypothetical protein
VIGTQTKATEHPMIMVPENETPEINSMEQGP